MAATTVVQLVETKDHCSASKWGDNWAELKAEMWVDKMGSCSVVLLVVHLDTSRVAYLVVKRVVLLAAKRAAYLAVKKVDSLAASSAAQWAACLVER